MGVFDGKQILNASVTSDKMAEDIFANMPIASSDEVLTNSSAGLKTNLSLVADGSDMVLYGRDNIELGRVNIAIGNIQNAYYDSARDEIVIVVVVQGGTDEIRIPADDLIDIYTGKEYIDVDNNNVISLNYELVKDQLIIDGFNTGINISDYYTSLQVNSLLNKYLPLEGGTVTGDLTVDGQLFYEGKRIYVEENIDEILTPGTYYIAASPTTIGGTLPAGFDPIQSSVLLVYSVGTTNGYKQVLYNNTRHFSRSIGAAGTPAAWYEYARTNDLASYLPLSGGAMKGNLQLNNNQLQLGTSPAQRLALDTQANAVELRSEISGGLKLTSTNGNLALSTPNNNIATYNGKEIATLDDVDNSRQFNTDEVTALKYGLSNGDGFYYDLTTSTGATNWTAELFYSSSEGRTGSSNLIVPSVNATDAGLVPASWYPTLNNFVTNGGNYITNGANTNLIDFWVAGGNNLEIGNNPANIGFMAFGNLNTNGMDIRSGQTLEIRSALNVEIIANGGVIELNTPSNTINLIGRDIYIGTESTQTGEIKIGRSDRSVSIDSSSLIMQGEDVSIFSNSGNVYLGAVSTADLELTARSSLLQGESVRINTTSASPGNILIGGSSTSNVNTDEVQLYSYSELTLFTQGKVDLNGDIINIGNGLGNSGITLGRSTRDLRVAGQDINLYGYTVGLASTSDMNITGGSVGNLNIEAQGSNLNIGTGIFTSPINIGTSNRAVEVNSQNLTLESEETAYLFTTADILGDIRIGTTSRSTTVNAKTCTLNASSQVAITGSGNVTLSSSNILLQVAENAILNSTSATTQLNANYLQIGTLSSNTSDLIVGHAKRNVSINGNTTIITASSTGAGTGLTLKSANYLELYSTNSSGTDSLVFYASNSGNINIGNTNSAVSIIGSSSSTSSFNSGTLNIGTTTTHTGTITIGRSGRDLNVYGSTIKIGDSINSVLINSSNTYANDTIIGNTNTSGSVTIAGRTTRICTGNDAIDYSIQIGTSASDVGVRAREFNLGGNTINLGKGTSDTGDINIGHSARTVNIVGSFDFSDIIKWNRDQGVTIGDGNTATTINSQNLTLESEETAYLFTTADVTGDINIGNNTRNINIYSDECEIIGTNQEITSSNRLNLNASNAINLGTLSGDSGNINIGNSTRIINVNSQILNLSSSGAISIGDLGSGTIRMGLETRPLRLISNKMVLEAGLGDISDYSDTSVIYIAQGGIEPIKAITIAQLKTLLGI